MATVPGKPQGLIETGEVPGTLDRGQSTAAVLKSALLQDWYNRGFSKPLCQRVGKNFGKNYGLPKNIRCTLTVFIYSCLYSEFHHELLLAKF